MGFRTFATASALAAASLAAAAGDTVNERILEADQGAGLYLDETTIMPNSAQHALVASNFDLQPGDREVLDVMLRGNNYPKIWQSQPSMGLGRYMIARPIGENPNVAKRSFGAPAKKVAEDRVQRLIDKRFDRVGELRLRLPDGMDPSAFTHFLMATGDYEYVEPDWIVSPVETFPNDPLFAASYHHLRIQSALAWDFVTGDNSVTVAICDTGVDDNHLDLAGSLVPGFNSGTNLPETSGGVTDDNTDSFGHGTFCAGMAAAIGNNNRDVVGAGWNFRIMPIKVSNINSGSAPNSDIQQGAQWAAVNGARIVNVSYSGVSSSSSQNTGAFLKNQNSLLFYSAGNDNAQLPNFEWNDVVVVAATNSSDNKAGFSNFGGMISLTAPGESVRSTRRGGGTTVSSGTSFSSPLAAGVAALIMSANPILNADEVQQILYDSVDDLGTPGEDNFFGRGRVNSLRAVEMALGSTELVLPIDDSFEGGSLDTDTWIVNSNVALVSPPLPATDGSSALRFQGTSLIESDALRGGSLDSTGGRVSLQLLERGVDAGEVLTIEYLDENDAWQTLIDLPSFSAQGRTGWVRYDFALPPDSLRTGLKVRVSTDTTDGDAEWFVDELAVEAITNPSPPMLEPVIVNALAGSAFFAGSTGAEVSTLADNEPSGDKSIRFTGTADLVTLPFGSTTAFEANPTLRFFYQTRGVPVGDRLVLELFDFNGPSIIGEIIATGADDPGFTEVVVDGWAFTPSFFGSNTIAFKRPDSTAGAWYFDELHLGADYQAIIPDAAPGGCNVADIAEAFGALNVNDVVDFVNGFNTSDPIADISPPGGNGSLNVNDVIDFVNAFNAGCP